MQNRSALLSLISATLLGFALLAAAGCRGGGGAVPESLPATLPESALPPLPPLELEERLASLLRPPADPLSLRWSAQPGDSWQEQISLQQTVQHSGPDLPQSSTEVEQSFTVSHRVTGQNDGAFSVAAELSSPEVRFAPAMAGMESRLIEKLDGLGYSYEVEPDGSKRGAPVSGDAVEAAGGLARALLANLEMNSLALPGEPVTVGDRWQRTREVALPAGAGAEVPATIDSEYVLAGVLLLDERRLAAIRVETITTMRGPLATAHLKGEVVGRSRGHGLVLFDLTLGRPWYSEHFAATHQQVLVSDAGERRLLIQDHTLRLSSEETQ